MNEEWSEQKLLLFFLKSRLSFKVNAETEALLNALFQQENWF